MEPHTDLLEVERETVGMPQLDFATFPNQIFWLIVAIVAIYLILSRVALPRISAVLAERRGSIANDIARAEELRLKAEEAEEAFRKTEAQARSEAARLAEKARAEVQEQLDLALAKADAEIAARMAESEARMAEIRDSAATAVEEVARATTAEVLASLGQGASVDAKAIAEAVRARAAQQGVSS